MLSIIIPIYNVSDFLPRCFDSIQRQGLANGEYEVILVDDGSTDDSKDVCMNYVGQNCSVFKYFYKENGGVSSARNYGLSKARGEYVYFMDGDDYLVTEGLSTVLRKYDYTSYELLYFSSRTVSNDNESKTTGSINLEGKSIYTGDGTSYIKEKGLNTFIWNMLIKRDFLLMHKIDFHPIQIAEDVLFNFHCMIHAKRILCVSDNIYRYVVRKDSAITNRSKQKMRKSVLCYLHLFSSIFTYATNSDDIAYKNALFYVIQKQFTPFFSRILSAEYTVSQFKELSLQITPFIEHLKKDQTIKFIQFVIKYPISYKLSSFIYKHIFMKCVYPLLSRN